MYFILDMIQYLPYEYIINIDGKVDSSLSKEKKVAKAFFPGPQELG